MSITIRTKTHVHLYGVKYGWAIPDSVLISIAGAQYLRLTGTCVRGMRQVLVRHNDLAPQPFPTILRLNTVLGLAELMRLRNCRHKDLLAVATQRAEPAPQAVNLLFGDAEPPQPQKRKAVRLSREQQKNIKNTPQVIDIELPPFDRFPQGATLNVLRPAQVQETLVVEFTAGTMEVLIHWLRCEGFTAESDYKRKDTTLPKGVCRKRAKFLARLAGGPRRTKLVATLAEALVAAAGSGQADFEGEPSDAEGDA